MLARSFDMTGPAVLNSCSLGSLVPGTDRYLDATTAKPGAYAYLYQLHCCPPPPPYVTQQQQQHACSCEGGCHLVNTGRQHGRLQYLKPWLHVY